MTIKPDGRMKTMLKLLFLLLTIMGLFFIPQDAFSASVEASALQYYENGIALMESKEYEQAILAFQKALSIDSTDRRVRIGMMYVSYMPNQKVKETKDLLEKQNNNPAMDKEGPTIVLYEPSIRQGLRIITIQASQISVRGLVKDINGVAFVRVNEKNIFVDDEGNFKTKILLHDGENPVIIESVDGVGNYSKQSLICQKDKEMNEPHKTLIDLSKKYYKKSFAIVIGINKYTYWPPLEFAVNDANEVKQTLIKTGFGKIHMLLDKKATKEKILQTLFYDLVKEIGTEDRVIVYFAGHGQTETLSDGSRMGYIIPVNADTRDLSTAISMKQIKTLSSNISAKHILYVMDSCYSGLGLNRSIGIVQTENDDRYLEKMASMRAVQIITAGGKGEQVLERGGNGLFTNYFLQGLNGMADINKDGAVTASELGTYLRPSVSKASEYTQTPLYGRFEGEGDFIFTLR